MPSIEESPRRPALNEQSVLVEPVFGYSKDGVTPYRPSLKEVISEWLDSINFIQHRNRSLIALNFLFHLLTAAIFVVSIIYYLSPGTFLFAAAAVVFIGTIYNTLWYHRYCSHAAFKFKRLYYTRIFLWTTPLFFREETYAIPHRIHHQRAEKPGDPYGPHLGWLGAYLAIDSSLKLNTAMTKRQFELMKRSIDHIGLKTDNYAQFQRTGSIESVAHYARRATFAQLFWFTIMFSVGGIPYVMAWFSAVFVTAALIRDFNWRGHGGDFRKTKKAGWEYEKKSRALNQHFYGYIASEWHDNHHNYPMSANNGFLPGQIDVAFLIIKLLHRLNVVESYIDARPKFQKEFLTAA